MAALAFLRIIFSHGEIPYVTCPNIFVRTPEWQSSTTIRIMWRGLNTPWRLLQTFSHGPIQWRRRWCNLNCLILKGYEVERKLQKLIIFKRVNHSYSTNIQIHLSKSLGNAPSVFTLLYWIVQFTKTSR